MTQESIFVTGYISNRKFLTVDRGKKSLKFDIYLQKPHLYKKASVTLDEKVRRFGELPNPPTSLPSHCSVTEKRKP